MQATNSVMHSGEYYRKEGEDSNQDGFGLETKTARYTKSASHIFATSVIGIESIYGIVVPGEVRGSFIERMLSTTNSETPRQGKVPIYSL